MGGVVADVVGNHIVAVVHFRSDTGKPLPRPVVLLMFDRFTTGNGEPDLTFEELVKVTRSSTPALAVADVCLYLSGRGQKTEALCTDP